MMMTGGLPFGLCGAALVGVGLYGLIVHASAFRRLLAFNLIGGGVFMLFGTIARRGASAGLPGDPVPQALVITGIVVAFAATALGVALVGLLSRAPAENPAQERSDPPHGADAA